MQNIVGSNFGAQNVLFANLQSDQVVTLLDAGAFSNFSKPGWYLFPVCLICVHAIKQGDYGSFITFHVKFAILGAVF